MYQATRDAEYGTCIMYRAMWTAPPVAAALAELAVGVQRARHAPACARAPPCCAYTHPQIATAASAFNIASTPGTTVHTFTYHDHTPGTSTYHVTYMVTYCTR